MTNPYYITIQFPEKYHANGYKYKLTIKFTVNDTGTSVTWDADDKNIKIQSYGQLEYKYNYNEFLLVPGKYTLKLYDGDGWFSSYMFGTSYTASVTDKKAEVKFEIDYNDGLGFVTEFIGNVVEKTPRYKKFKKEINFNVAPRTDILNKTMLYNDKNESLKPLAVIDSIYNDKNAAVTLNKLLVDIYKLVNGNISTISFSHDWLFGGQLITEDFIETYQQGMTFSNLYVPLKYYFFTPSFGFVSIGDILRNLAIMFCSYTGMLDTNTAIFKKVSRNTASAIELISEDMLIDIEQRHEFNQLDYVKFIYQTVPSDYKAMGKGDETAKQLESGYNSKLEDRILLRQLPFWFFKGQEIDYENGGILCYKNQSNLKAYYNSNWYWLFVAKDPSLTYTDSSSPYNNNYNDIGKIGSDFWYNFRGNMVRNQVIKLSIDGIKYPFLKDYQYDGIIYSPIQFIKDYDKFKTEIDTVIAGVA